MQAPSVYVASGMLITKHSLKGGRIAAFTGYNEALVKQNCSASGLDALFPAWKSTLTSRPANEQPSRVRKRYNIDYIGHPVGYIPALRIYSEGPRKLIASPVSLYGKQQIDYNEFAEGRQNCNLCGL